MKTNPNLTLNCDLKITLNFDLIITLNLSLKSLNKE
jgi:hypothetical protein